MKEILLTFKTETGVQAYKKSEEEGASRPKMERRMVRCVFKDTLVSLDPLIIKIKIKSWRLAVQLDLPKQIEEGLKKFGAEKDRDYSMEVS